MSVFDWYDQGRFRASKDGEEKNHLCWSQDGSIPVVLPFFSGKFAV